MTDKEQDKTNQAKTKKWKFNRPSDRIITTTSAVAGLGALGVGLSLAFNPAALAVAGGIAAVNAVAGQLFSIPAYRKFAINKQIKKGKWAAVPKDAPASKITAEISDQLGRAKPPEVYTVDLKTVAKFALPFGMRWMLKSQEDKVMSGIFAAIPGANTVITTKQALNNGLTENQLRFIAAHEMSHLQAKDNRSPSLTASGIIKKATRVLLWGSLAAVGAGLAGVTLPVFAAPAALAAAALGGAYIAARVTNNFGMRTVEQRADRNALYITRDLESAKSGLAKADPTVNSGLPRLKELFFDHPFYKHRVKIMTKAFNKIVAKAPVLAAPAKPAAAPVPPQKPDAPTV